jgi:uncharacterized coiled-coil protein SlyX
MDDNIKYSEIEFELYVKSGDSYRKTNIQKRNVEVKEEAIKITLDHLYYINKLEIDFSSLENQNIKIDYYSQDGQKKLCDKGYIENNILVVNVNDILNVMYLYSNRGDLTAAKNIIKSLKIYGLTLIEIEKYIDQIKKIETLKQETLENIEKQKGALEEQKININQNIAELETKQASLSQAIDELTESQAEAEANNIKAQEDLTVITEKLNSQKEDLNKKKSEYTDLEGSLGKAKANLKSTRDEISKNESEIRELVKKYSLLSNEYASYNLQGNNFIRFYTILSILPISLIVGFVYKLYCGTVDLTTMYKADPGIDLLTIFSTRMPFVTLGIGIITASFIVLKLLIMKIFDIQSDKMALTKLSILAQDVVNVSAEDLELTDFQVHEANIYLRMELLKSYMKGDISRDFQYKIRDKELLDKAAKGLLVPQHIGSKKENENSTEK